MQYADIALAVKTAHRQISYTYKIPPVLLTDMHLGQRVTVPFAGRRLIGTVTNLRSQPPKIRGQLKEITGLVEPFPLFSPNDLELARQVAQLYGATVGQVLEIAGSKPAKRTAKKLEVQLAKPTNQKHEGTLFSLSKPLDKRLADYLKLIKKAHQHNQGILVLWPTQELCHYFSRFLSDNQLNSLVMPPTADLTDHYEAWIAARLGTAQIVIGTRKTIFAPVTNLGLIIIDSPSLYGYKEEQFPYYHALTVAKPKATINRAHLVIGDSAPRLLEWSEIQRRLISQLAEPSTQTRVTVIDTTTHRGLLSDILIRHIDQTIANKQKVALYFNRKGSGRFYRCLECESAIYCPRCDNLLTVFDSKLKCSHCDYETKPPIRCEVCQSHKLGATGLGVESVAKILADHYPEQKIATLSQATERLPDHDILIATAELFYLPANHHYHLLAAFHIDQLLHGPDWDTNEMAYLTLTHLAERCDHLLLHTTEANHPAIVALTAGNRDQFYRTELAERQQHSYPPITPIIKLSTSGVDQEKVKRSAEELYRCYQQLLPNPEQQLFPPSRIGSGKRRGKFRYQIIIKSALTNIILDNLPTDWQIDPEPTEL